MADARCPGCSKPLPPGAPLGLCPECLIKSGFHTGTAPPSSGRRGSPPLPVDQLRPLFPQLEIIDLIGQGGMGAVYQARQPGLNRLVALKILPPAVSGDAGFTDRFTREAQLLARLQHPRIVAIHDVGVAGDLRYLLMEYVDGPNLRQVQRSGRLAPEQALRIVPEICEALQFAHDRGVVHRDIKPENVLLDRDGHVKITDFGIAKMIGPDADTMGLTGTIDVIGTPHYMAPEQIERPLDVDHRADIYSLGVVFYELLTGELPLGRFAAPSQRVQVDVRLDDVVLRALEKEPARRYQQVSEVKTRLDTIAGSVPTRIDGRAAGRSGINWLVPALLYFLQAVTLWLVWGSVGGLLLQMRAELGVAGVPLVVLLPQVESGWLVWLALPILALAVGYAAWGILHYACWKALPERHRRTTPGMEAGLLFVPLFNFYWAFASLRRLAAGFEAWGEEHPDRPIKPARNLAIAKAASFVACWTIGLLPVIAVIVGLVDVVLFALYYRVIAHNADEVIDEEGISR